MSTLIRTSLVLLGMLALTAAGIWQVQQRDQQLSRLEQRLQHLEQGYTQLIDIVQASSSLQPAATVAAVRAAPAATSLALVEPPQTLVAAPAASHTNQVAAKPDGSSQPKASAAAQSFASIQQTGYIDADSWAQVDASVRAMNKDENKQFWQRTFAAIQQGDVAVYPVAAQ